MNTLILSPTPYNVRQIRQAFKTSDLPLHWLDEWLLYVLEQSSAFIVANPDYLLNDEQMQKLQAGLVRLLAGEPLAYLLGRAYFWRDEFLVNSATLIPRPDTELLVATAIELLNNTSSPRLLDMGTGSGCIAISLAKALADNTPTVIACDKSKDALTVAHQNAERLHAVVDFVLSDWYDNITGSFDMIVANPPYIDPSDVHLDKLRCEPLTALVADNKGLADIYTIIDKAYQHLNDGGYLLIEHGYNQGKLVYQRFIEAGFNQVQTLCDYGGNPRLTLGKFHHLKE